MCFGITVILSTRFAQLNPLVKIPTVKVDASTFSNGSNGTVGNHVTQRLRRTANVVCGVVNTEEPSLVAIAKPCQNAVRYCVRQGVQPYVSGGCRGATTLLPHDRLGQAARREGEEILFTHWIDCFGPAKAVRI
jgi:hypothetical protein